MMMMIVITIIATFVIPQCLVDRQTDRQTDYIRDVIPADRLQMTESNPDQARVLSRTQSRAIDACMDPPSVLEPITRARLVIAGVPMYV